MNENTVSVIALIAFFTGFSLCAILESCIISSKNPIVVEAYATLRLEKIPITLPPGNGSFWLWNEQTKTSVRISDETVIYMANNFKKK